MIIVMVAQLICGLMLLVFVHELGHFLAARAFKIRVPKFYLFFNPNFSLVKCKKINGKWRFRFLSRNLPDMEKVLDEKGQEVLDTKGKPKMRSIDASTLPDEDWRKYPDNTEYGLGWVPLGGYCQIAGMIDETQSVESMSSQPQSWEYRSKPAWQRLIVVLGGVIVNMIVGVLLFAAIIWHFEKEYLPNAAITDGVYAYAAARDLGFRSGDKIVSIDNEPVERFKDVIPRIVFGAIVSVDRDGSQQSIVIGDEAYESLKNARGRFLSFENFKISIDSVFPEMSAGKADLRKGDVILSLNDTILTPTFGDLLEKLPAFSNREIQIAFLRNGDTLRKMVTVDAEGKIGFVPSTPTYATQNYGIGASFYYGWKDAIQNLWLNIQGIGRIFTGKEKATSISGPIGIAQIYGKTWDWQHFWYITGLLSLVLAFMNVLPIPGLDGAHALMALFEMVTRRKVPDAFLQTAQMVGMILILLLMAFVIGNDIFKLIGF